MNWRFWTHPRPDEICAQIAPLLSLESDGMASPAETARIAAHLQTCDACRQARMWMEATRQVIVQRPAVVPPSALRARIVQAMAQTAPAPVRPAPRPLILRPAFAAACSLTLVGAVALRLLWLGQTPPVVAPVPPRIARTSRSPVPVIKRAAPSAVHVARAKPSPARLLAVTARPPRSLVVAQTQTIEKRSPVSSVPAPVPPKRNPRVILARSGDNVSAAAPLPVRKTTIPEPTRVAVQPPTARTPLVETPAPPVEPAPAAPELDKSTVVASAPPPVIARPDTNSALRSGLLNRQGEARAVRTVHASASTGSLSRTASYDPDRESRSGILSAVNSDQVQQR